jgi:mersacidin/lichenicidin family type 2 lantibiotic
VSFNRRHKQLKKEEINMTHRDIIRAWKDPEYRSRLSKAEREQLPAHPSGLMELSDDDLHSASGADIPVPPYSHAWTCSWPACTVTHNPNCNAV